MIATRHIKKYKLVPDFETSIKPFKINSSMDVDSFCKRELFKDYMSVQEAFYLIYVDNNNQVVGYSLMSIGTINMTIIDFRILAKSVLDSLAARVILAHNHPSGQLKSSNNDDQLTNKVKRLLEPFDVSVLDHIITTENGYFSYADEGKI